MTRRTFWAMAMVALMLALPLASADWRGRGFVEPDTRFDQDSGYMWPDPDTDPDVNVRQIYFNIYSTYFIVPFNHNVGALGTQSMPYPTSVHAILGVWKDCNNDGFIGHAEGLMLEYPSSLLLNDDICVATPGDYTARDYEARHNDGNWVMEFIPIGPEQGGYNNPFKIADPEAKIWGDFGLPEWSAEPTCPLNPRPTGTYRSTGGFLRYADCFTGWRTLDAINLVAHTSGQDHLAFDDVPNEDESVRRPHESGSTLNVQNPWGNEGDASMYTVWDCSDAGTPVASPDPDTADEQGNLLTLRPPSTSSMPSLAGSPAGTVNETEEGMHSCNRADDSAENDGPLQGYDGVMYADEDPFEGTGTKRKQTDFEFVFVEGNGGCPSTSPTVRRACPIPPFGGLNLVRNNGALDGSIHSAGYWYGSPGYTGSRNPYLNRLTLQPRGAVYVTGYAFVDATTVGASLPPAAVEGIYGSDHCAGTTPTPTGTWECDTSKWWIDGSTGESIVAAHHALPGDPYVLLDADCYDGSAEAAPEASLSIVGETICERPLPPEP